MTASFPSVSNLDKIASFIVSDVKHVQECNYVCSWQLGLVFLAGKVWRSDFLDRITLAVSCWNVRLQEQKVAEWHAVTCLVTNLPQSNIPLSESPEITKKISSKKQKATSFVAESVSFTKEQSSLFAYFPKKLIQRTTEFMQYQINKQKRQSALIMEMLEQWIPVAITIAMGIPGRQMSPSQSWPQQMQIKTISLISSEPQKLL